MVKYALWWLSLIFLTLVSCSSGAGEDVVADEFSVEFDLPQLVDVTKGGEYVFQVENGAAPIASDVFILESGEGISYICPFVNISKQRCTIRIPAE